MPGSGFWVNERMAVAATGEGEEITRALLSYRVSEMAESDSCPSLRHAMNWGLENLIMAKASVGLIAIGTEGPGEGLANTDMPWASWIED